MVEMERRLARVHGMKRGKASEVAETKREGESVVCAWSDDQFGNPVGGWPCADGEQGRSCRHSTPRELVSINKKNKRLWSSNDWKKKLSSFINFFQSIRDLGLLHNHTKVICVSAGAGHEVVALSHIGVHDVTGIELIDSPPLVSRADPHNLPFFDHVFDLAFTAHLAEALFSS
ncbi:uncharacterized protein E6C27_scaffold316G00690 [Cucumis melo var. makuwa]|uniref:Uncharacterized protein n=1 Tax=Cucumis melo var. makuwa TaxID=1194695 RepID=A0A5A7TQA6_CUCMM|nr:uncharacterized protein E6C27_scaffold316G00690 [Cucumis melo var. makuwa]